MDPGLRSPLVDFFRRGEVARDVRLLAAQGALAPRAHEQVALLVLLADDPDADIARAAALTIGKIPEGLLSAFLARTDVPDEMRAFFAAKGIDAAGEPAAAADEPLVEVPEPVVPEIAEPDKQDPKLLSQLPIVERMKVAMKGTRDQRAQLIRDSNKLVAAAVLSSPKLSEAEVEAFAKMANVSEEVLRVIGTNRSWLKNYSIVLGLTRNPKTPPGISMQLLHRLNERDVKMLAIDRNVPEALRLQARKMMVKALK
jgi:hypothetical protein